MIWSFLRQHYTTDVLRMYYSHGQVGLTELFNDYSNFNRSGTNTYTRNTLTQASKNGRKPYLFPQKKFISVFYAINIF